MRRRSNANSEAIEEAAQIEDQMVRYAERVGAAQVQEDARRRAADLRAGRPVELHGYLVNFPAPWVRVENGTVTPIDGR